ncbi:hypothetical protein [Xanthomarina sp. F2636L]|uniref:hypothetical protein n=1 Tax=Xanthomarina sp. F2636L TaxID=2996018 RepID=UPI00225E4821|nr:hypothetical protein [Xanthomarina sp. F2636L]MCX7549269.1 hypothetical protein [Xanthomarina sp. F2636L]
MNTEKGQYKYITEYVSEGKRYGGSIFAMSKKEAEKKLEDKRLTERIVGYDPETLYLND